MTFLKVRNSAFLLASLLLVPGLKATTVGDCTPAKPAAEMYKGNSEREATHLIKKIEGQSMVVKDDVDVLRAMTRTGDLDSWKAHAIKLAEVRSNVNKMGTELCRLQAIRSSVLPWQQQAINQFQPAVIELADYTEQAIDFTHGEDMANFSAPAYTNDLTIMYQESARIDRTAGDLVENAKVQHDLQQMGRG